LLAACGPQRGQGRRRALQLASTRLGQVRQLTVLKSGVRGRTARSGARTTELQALASYRRRVTLAFRVTDEVIILRVLYGGRDMDALLRDAETGA
jgi:plasmid stabilization system protein ParE